MPEGIERVSRHLCWKLRHDQSSSLYPRGFARWIDILRDPIIKRMTENFDASDWSLLLERRSQNGRFLATWLDGNVVAVRASHGHTNMRLNFEALHAPFDKESETGAPHARLGLFFIKARRWPVVRTRGIESTAVQMTNEREAGGNAVSERMRGHGGHYDLMMVVADPAAVSLREAARVKQGVDTAVLVDLHALMAYRGTVIARSLEDVGMPLLVTRGAGGKGVIPVDCVRGAFDLMEGKYFDWRGQKLTAAEAWYDGVAYPSPGGSPMLLPEIQHRVGWSWDQDLTNWLAHVDLWGGAYDSNTYHDVYPDGRVMLGPGAPSRPERADAGPSS